jgi:hypothetical protein
MQYGMEMIPGKYPPTTTMSMIYSSVICNPSIKAMRRLLLNNAYADIGWVNYTCMFKSRRVPTSGSQNDLDSGCVELRKHGTVDIPCKTS